MALCLFILKAYCVAVDGMPEFLASIVVGVFIYFGIACLFDKFFGYGVKSIVKESLSLLR